ncbi:MAG: protein jag [Clostridia bacterium]|nr:protein jag [Clostridia bacterium]
MQSIEMSAKTKDEAIAAALAKLGASIDEVEVEIIEEGAKGFLGFGNKDAVVKVTLLPNPVRRAEDFLNGLFKLANEDVTVDVSKNDESLDIEFSGPDMGIIIGKRGETLDAIQHLTSLVVNRGDDEFIKVSCDTENYRAKRNEALESLAHKLARKVAKTRRNTTLEPMNAYERRIIHAALQDDKYVTTYSVGQGVNRKVVIALKK